MSAEPDGPVVLYGATGYTGRLVARQLLARGASVLLAGRSRDRLDALARSLDGLGDLGVAAAPLDDPAALRRVMAFGPVVVNCAGPFARTGRPVLEAAIDAGTHYLDTTGEQDWIRSVFEDLDPSLSAAGVAAVPGMAFSHAPGDLLCHLVGAAVEPVRILTVAYHVDGFQMSRGTMHSSLEQMNGLDVAYESGTWTPGGNPARHETYAFPGAIGRRRVARYPVGDVITVPRHVRAQEVRARISTVSIAPRPVAGAVPFITPLLGRVLRSRAKGALEAMIARLPEGPAEADRGAVQWTVAVTAIGENGAESRGIAHGPDIYGFSSHSIAEAALRMACGFERSGALAASQAFDPAGFLGAMAVCGVRWNAAPQPARV